MDVMNQQASSEDGCCQSPQLAGRRVALTDLRNGEEGVISEAVLDESEAAFLRAMGLCVAARIKLRRAGEPCIVSVGNDCGCRGSTCRIGLARPLAEKIFVTVKA